MRRTKRQQLLSVSVSALAVAALVVLCWTHRHQLSEALKRLPLTVFAAAVGLHVLALSCRAEAWVVTLRAIGPRGARALGRGRERLPPAARHRPSRGHTARDRARRDPGARPVLVAGRRHAG